VLGFDALQLSTDRDPLAPHAETPAPGSVTLATLVESGRLVPARPELLRDPPRIPAADPRARAALGYLSSNCGTCHNAQGPLASLGLDLRHRSAAKSEADEPAVRTTFGVASRYALPGAAPGTSFRVVPGSPDAGTLVHRMQSRRP
jgi:mono/diheme cytochrome c family protein